MNASEKPIVISSHARGQLASRGSNEEEICDTIRSSEWKPAELGRLEAKKDYLFNQLWNGKSYKTKQVRPIFADEQDRIVVITVYVYYF